MSEVPPRCFQVQFAKKLQHELAHIAVPSDWGYPVSKEWLAALFTLTEERQCGTDNAKSAPELDVSDTDYDTREQSFEVLPLMSRPEEASILSVDVPDESTYCSSQMQSFEVLPLGEEGRPGVSAIFDSDAVDGNEFLTEQMWQVLAGWYGVRSDYNFYRRPAGCSYVHISSSEPTADCKTSNMYILADNTLDFVSIPCCLLKEYTENFDILDKPHVTFYMWESLDYLRFQLCCRLRVPPEERTRVWLIVEDDGDTVLVENLDGYDQRAGSVGAVACGKLPEMLMLLESRQAAPPPHLPHVVPGVTPVKEDLATLFLSNQLRLVLCLEMISLPNAAEQSPAQHYRSPDCLQSGHNYSGRIPAVFRNVDLSHIFRADSRGKFDPDSKIEQILEEHKVTFCDTVSSQQKEVQARVEDLLQEAKERYDGLEKKIAARAQKLSDEEEKLKAKEKELDDRERELSSKLAKFKSKLTDFLMTKERFEKEVAQMREQNSIKESQVVLNVGGVRYTTSRETLLKEPSSRLETMFKGQHPVQPDSDASYFLDRDGTNFRYILNFLRDGPVSLMSIPHPSGDSRLITELCVEAEFYQLHRMVVALRARIAGLSEDKTTCQSLPS